MHNALADFKVGMAEARQSGVVYDYLAAQLGAQFSFEDLLRFQLVYSVSAFDKFIHDLIRIGMRDCFSGVRLQTAKFKAEQIALELHGVIASKAEDELRAKIFHLPTPVPPKEYIFEQEVQKKLSQYSYQDPDKISEGLALIWSENHKWEKISSELKIDSHKAKTELKLIVSRRNAIVHEADIDPISKTKRPINRQNVSDISDFLEQCGIAIAKLVI